MRILSKETPGAVVETRVETSARGTAMPEDALHRLRDFEDDFKGCPLPISTFFLARRGERREPRSGETRAGARPRADMRRWTREGQYAPLVLGAGPCARCETNVPSDRTNVPGLIFVRVPRKLFVLIVSSIAGIRSSHRPAVLRGSGDDAPAGLEPRERGVG